MDLLWKGIRQRPPVVWTRVAPNLRFKMFKSERSFFTSKAIQESGNFYHLLSMKAFMFKFFCQKMAIEGHMRVKVKPLWALLSSGVDVL